MHNLFNHQQVASFGSLQISSSLNLPVLVKLAGLYCDSCLLISSNRQQMLYCFRQYHGEFIVPQLHPGNVDSCKSRMLPVFEANPTNSHYHVLH